MWQGLVECSCGCLHWSGPSFCAQLFRQIWNKSCRGKYGPRLLPFHFVQEELSIFQLWTCEAQRTDGLSKALQQVPARVRSRQGSDNQRGQSVGHGWATGSSKVIWKNIANSSLPSIYTKLSWSLWIKSLLFLTCSQVDKAEENRINTWMFWVCLNLDL